MPVTTVAPSSLPALPRRLGMVCVVLFLSLPFLLPFNTLPVPSFYQEWTALVLGSVLLASCASMSGDVVLRVPRVALLPLGMAALILMHALFGRVAYWQHGTIAILYLLWAAAMMWAGSVLRQTLGWERFCALVAGGLAATATLNAIAGIAQFLGFRLGGAVVPMVVMSAHGNLAQPNQFANLLFLGLFSLCFLAASGRLNHRVAAAAVLPLLFAAELSGSRSLWVYLVVAMVLACWFFYRSRSAQARTVLIWAVALPIAMTAVAIVADTLLRELPLFPEAATTPLTASEKFRYLDGRDSERIVIWTAAWEMFRNAPLAGVGFGAFAHEYFLASGAMPPGMPEQITDNAHNIVLHVLAEFGLPGALLLFVSTSMWAWPRLRDCRTVQGWWLLSVVGVIVVHSLAEYPLWYAHFLGIFALFAGAGDDKHWRIARVRQSRVISVGLVVLLMWPLMSAFIDYRRVERLGFESRMADDNRAALMEAARVSTTSIFGHMVELGLSRTIALDQVALEAKLELNGRVLRAFPAPDVAFRQSALLALHGDMDDARRLWALAGRAFPRYEVSARSAIQQRVSAGVRVLEPLVEYAASLKTGGR